MEGSRRRQSASADSVTTECGRKFNISPHTIMMRAKRHRWAVPSKIASVSKRYKASLQSAQCAEQRSRIVTIRQSKSSPKAGPNEVKQHRAHRVRVRQRFAQSGRQERSANRELARREFSRRGCSSQCWARRLRCPQRLNRDGLD